MPKSKGPRRKYKKPEYDTRTHGRVPSLFRTAPDREQWLKLVPHGHLDALHDGSGGRLALAYVSVRIHLGYALAQAFFDDEVLEELLTQALWLIADLEAAQPRADPVVTTEAEHALLGKALTRVDELQANTKRVEQARALAWARANTNYLPAIYEDFTL